MKNLSLILIVILCVVAACKPGVPMLESLTANEWELTTVQEQDSLFDAMERKPTLLLTDTATVYGFAGCNRFFGKYEAKETGEIKINVGGATMMFCPNMAFEGKYTKALGTVASFSVKENRLHLLDQDKNVLYTFVPVVKK